MKIKIASLFALMICLTSGQKKEIEAAFKAYEAKDLNTTKAEIEKASILIGSNSEKLEPELFLKYLYTAGNSRLDAGDLEKAVPLLAELSLIEKNLSAYAMKNKETKERNYFYIKETADKLYETGKYTKPDKLNLSPIYSIFLLPKIQKAAVSANEQAQKDYKEKRFVEAGKNFLKTYQLMQAAGMTDTAQYYFAALSYHRGENKDKALAIYQDLIKMGYTGLNADNKENLLPSLYNYAGSLLYEKQNYQEALNYAKEGLEKFPADQNLNHLLGNLYLKTGNNEQYIALLKQNIQKDPNQAVYHFNLGVMLSKKEGQESEAEAAYRKAIELKPDYVEAYLNLAYLIAAPDKKYLETLQKIGSSTKRESIIKTKKILQERKLIYQKIQSILEKALSVSPENPDVLQGLKTTYEILEIKNKP